MHILKFIFLPLIWYPISTIAQTRTVNSQEKNTPEFKYLNEQIAKYDMLRDTPKVIRYTIKKVEKYGLDTAGLGRVYANNMIFELIFKFSYDTLVLKKGLKWTKSIIDSEYPIPEHIDTYANLLYKLYRKKEAIQWEEKAMRLAPYNTEIKETLQKMKNNIPTWHIRN